MSSFCLDNLNDSFDRLEIKVNRLEARFDGLKNVSKTKPPSPKRKISSFIYYKNRQDQISPAFFCFYINILARLLPGKLGKKLNFKGMLLQPYEKFNFSARIAGSLRPIFSQKEKNLCLHKQADFLYFSKP
ncbi:MAG: hypothetical protein A2259_03765 [Candidatus Moranbacteria bacterium RIFOXYA2_FULL_43_15]|nr:MAG: hypothetical protein A2259_03765 [Candidatus Moranbacteria bacterium RIFOXYA2_FULL_43_15]